MEKLFQLVPQANFQSCLEFLQQIEVDSDDPKSLKVFFSSGEKQRRKKKSYSLFPIALAISAVQNATSVKKIPLL